MARKSALNLEKVKRFLDFVENKDDCYMLVKNKETEKEGYANIRKDKKIAVFEVENNGNEDGVYSQKEFKQKFIIEDFIDENAGTTIEEIETDLSSLDTEYREALAVSLKELKYISDYPIRLQYGTEKQQRELERVWKKPLKQYQVNEIMKSIKDKMKSDFQYGFFRGIASNYISDKKDLEVDKNVKKRIKKSRSKKRKKEIEK